MLSFWHKIIKTVLKAQKYYIFWISLHINLSVWMSNFKTSVLHCNLLCYIKALHRWRKRICVLHALPKWPIRHLSSFWWLLWFNNFSYSKWSFGPRQKPAWHSLGPLFTSCCLFLQACVPFMGMHGEFFTLVREWGVDILAAEDDGPTHCCSLSQRHKRLAISSFHVPSQWSGTKC